MQESNPIKPADGPWRLKTFASKFASAVKNGFAVLIAVSILNPTISVYADSDFDFSDYSLIDLSDTERLSDNFLRFIDDIESGRADEYDYTMPYPYKVNKTILRSSDNTPLPEKFDPRSADSVLVTPVKDQGMFGTCWTFSTIATIEHFLLASKSVSESPDFSEEHMVWSFKPESRQRGWVDNTSKDVGGNVIMSAGFITSIGVKNEDDIPYDNIFDLSETSPPRLLSDAETKYTATDLIYVNEDRDSIKYAVKTYGAVSTAFFSDDSYANRELTAYSNKISLSPNHAVTVVGWDDNYSKHNFGGKTPPSQDGAWLVKNSYGSAFNPEGGYIYISYEDTSLFSDIPYAIKSVLKNDDSNKIYQLDEFGATVSLHTADFDMENLVACANIFNFDSSYRQIDAITFCTETIGASYSIYYAPLNKNGIPSSPDKVLLASGDVMHSGYITKTLDEPFIAPEGKGSIVLKLSKKPSLETDLTIGTDASFGYLGEYLFYANASEDESLILVGNRFKTTTNVIGQTVNFSLKAITSKVDPGTVPSTANINQKHITVAEPPAFEFPESIAVFGGADVNHLYDNEGGCFEVTAIDDNSASVTYSRGNYTSAPTVIPIIRRKLGMINGDSLSILDALSVIRYISGLPDDVDFSVELADIDRDGQITENDAALIFRKLAIS